MRTELFWDFKQRVVVIPCRRFGPFFKGQESLKMLSIRFPATSVRNCHYSLRNIPEQRSSQCKHLLLKQFIVLQEKIVGELTNVGTGCDCVPWYSALKRAYGTSPCLQTMSVAFVKWQLARTNQSDGRKA